MKRILPFLIIFLFLVSCSSGNGESLVSFIDGSSSVDYQGYQVTIAQLGDVDTTVLVYEDNTSLQSETLKNRIADVEKKLNVDLIFTNKGMDNASSYYLAAILSGNTDVDIFNKNSGSTFWDLGSAGVFMPINGFPDYINLDDYDKYGTPGALEPCMFNGIPYMVLPTYWPGFQGIECFFVSYNKDIQNGLSLTDLHEYYENGTWTWNTLIDVCNQAYDRIADDTYILTGYDSYFLNTLMISNGFKYVTIDNGVPTFNTLLPSAVTAIDFYRQLVTSYGEKVLIRESGRWDISEFVAGKALMAMTVAKDVTIGAIPYNTDFSYGIMPFPCGPDCTYGEWAQTVTRCLGFAIPICCEEPEISAHVISELFEPFEEFGGSREGLIDYYKTNVFMDEIDAEIYFAVDRDVRYDYDDVGIIENYCGPIADQVNKASSTELIQKYTALAQKAYTNYIQPNLTNYIIERMYSD